MKRIIATLLLIALFLTANPTFAEGLDFASMNDEQLQAIIDGAKAELSNRNGNSSTSDVLIDQNGIKMYMTGNHEIWGSDDYYYDMEVVVENNSDKPISIDFESASINGWEVYASGVYDTGAGKKQKGNLEFKISDADISSIEEIEEMELFFYIFDNESYNTLYKLDPITLVF